MLNEKKKNRPFFIILVSQQGELQNVSINKVCGCGY